MPVARQHPCGRMHAAGQSVHWLARAAARRSAACSSSRSTRDAARCTGARVADRILDRFRSAQPATRAPREIALPPQQCENASLPMPIRTSSDAIIRGRGLDRLNLAAIRDDALAEREADAPGLRDPRASRASPHAECRDKSARPALLRRRVADALDARRRAIARTVTSRWHRNGRRLHRIWSGIDRSPRCAPAAR